MLATQAMAVDTARQDFYPNLDFADLINRSGLWPEFPPFSLDFRPPQSICSQFDLGNQMTLQATVVPDFSHNQGSVLHAQGYQQDQPWPAKDICSPQPQDDGYLSAPPAQDPQAFEKLGGDQDMMDMDRPNQTVSNQEYTSLGSLLHGEQSRVGSFPVGHLRHQSSVDFGEDLLRNSHDTVNENIFAEWCWGPGECTATRTAHEGSVQWGSDSSFGSPRGSHTTITSTSGNPRPFPHLKVSEQKETGPMLLPRGYSSGFCKLKTGISASLSEHPITWPVLRTRTSPIDRDVLSTYRALSLEYLGSALHEHKPLATVGPRREKLTEEQKRRNHILHEQKRRAMIKEGFDDLLTLVPDLRDRGLSKSAILAKAAEWLGSLACGNKALRAQARVLEGADNTTNSNKVAPRQQRSYRRSSRRS